MMEILIISILITVWLFTVRNAVDHARKTNENVKQSVIANQLATEWAELVYQLRNTNFLEYYYNRDVDKSPRIINACRLAYNFWDCYEYIRDASCNSTQEFTKCTDADKYIMRGLNYYISWWKINACGCIFENKNCQDIKNDVYAICLRNWVRTPCPEGHDAWWDESTFWKFWRMIDGIWTYNMASDYTWWELINSSFNCGDLSAQEYRFCSRVAREWGWWHGWEVEICWTMTNFAEIEGEIVR